MFKDFEESVKFCQLNLKNLSNQDSSDNTSSPQQATTLLISDQAWSLLKNNKDLINNQLSDIYIPESISKLMDNYSHEFKKVKIWEVINNNWSVKSIFYFQKQNKFQPKIQSLINLKNSLTKI